jgi:hypothetical protein
VTEAADGRVVFLDRRDPPLPAGTVTVTVRQRLATTAAVTREAAKVDLTQETTRRLCVRGERFALDPGELLAVFPPAENRGEYATVLPHVVFARATLPWERSADGTVGGPPWLALLLFEEADPAPSPQPVTVRDLRRGGGLPADAVAAALTLDDGESETDPCTVIDVPVALFAAIAPSRADLGWLAHVRQVGTAAKSAAFTAPTQENAVLVGSRLPAPNTRCAVHLVSLEGLAGLLRPAAADPPPPLTAPDRTPARVVRLVSLASWGFVSADPQQTFSGYLESVDVGPLRRPVPTNPLLTDAFGAGFTALPHHTADGRDGVSWHRGPLLPGPAAPRPTATTDAAAPAPTAEAAVRVDGTTGLPDVSHAVAWELGRLLALASPGFSRALHRYKRDAVATAAQAPPIAGPAMGSTAFLAALNDLELPR